MCVCIVSQIKKISKNWVWCMGVGTKSKIEIVKKHNNYFME